MNIEYEYEYCLNKMWVKVLLVTRLRFQNGLEQIMICSSFIIGSFFPLGVLVLFFIYI